MTLNEAGNEYQNGKSLRALSEKTGIPTTSLRRKLIAAGVEMRSQKRKDEDFLTGELVTFNGREYFPNPKGYMRARKLPRTYLHRDVFEFFSKRKIKPDHDVNHRDHNKLNWLFCNLEEIDHTAHGHETNHFNKNNGSELPGDDKVPF